MSSSVDFNARSIRTEPSPTRPINAALPTIRKLISEGAQDPPAIWAVPRGNVLTHELAPVARSLADKLSIPVLFLDDCVGEGIVEAVGALENGQVVLLENLRFHSGETNNDPAFAGQLASLADLYVNDAFGTAHRAHASTYGVAELLPEKVSGYLIERELEFLGGKTESPERPFVVILGGAKVSDKITVIDKLIDKADVIIIGGAMAYTFALANGKTVGDSLSEPDKVNLAKAALAKASQRVRFLCPSIRWSRIPSISVPRP